MVLSDAATGAPGKRTPCMLTLSSKQMNTLRESRHETAVSSVARFMLETQPAGSLYLPEARLAVLARQ